MINKKEAVRECDLWRDDSAEVVDIEEEVKRELKMAGNSTEVHSKTGPKRVL